MGSVGVVLLALVLELAHVVGEDDAQRLDAGKALLEVFAMALDGGAERPEVHAVGADADGAAPAAGAERQDLVEAIEQAGPLPLLDEPFELRPVGGELRARSATGAGVQRLFLQGRRRRRCPGKPSRAWVRRSIGESCPRVMQVAGFAAGRRTPGWVLLPHGGGAGQRDGAGLPKTGPIG